MKVADVMSRHLVSVTPQTMVIEAAKLMSRERIGALAVQDKGRLVGIVTDRDITLNAVANGEIRCPVSDIMTPHPTPIDAYESLDVAVELMRDHDVRRLPVLEDGHLVGMITLTDLVEADEAATLQALRAFHRRTAHA